jgi:hypothetical protein
VRIRCNDSSPVGSPNLEENRARRSVYLEVPPAVSAVTRHTALQVEGQGSGGHPLLQHVAGGPGKDRNLPSTTPWRCFVRRSLAWSFLGACSDSRNALLSLVVVVRVRSAVG